MIFHRQASFGEFAVHYLNRESRKQGKPQELSITLPEAVGVLESRHAGKVRPWFAEAAWWFVELEGWEEMAALVFLASPETRRSGLVPHIPVKDSRLLWKVGKRALHGGYLENFASSKVAHYAGLFAAAQLHCLGDNSLVLCSLDPSEESSSPNGTFYLHDGAARGLALWLHHLQHPESSFPKVEAFVALKSGHPVLNRLRERQP